MTGINDGNCVHPETRLAAGKDADVFRFGSDILKLYRLDGGKRRAFREAAVLAILESFGLPVPVVREVVHRSGRWGLIMSRAEGRVLGHAMASDPDSAAPRLAGLAQLHARLHACRGIGLPALRTTLAIKISDAAGLSGERRRGLLEQLVQLPDGDRLCHGDFHPWNVVGDPPDGATVIDWLDATCGDPAADACRSYLLMRSALPELASVYLSTYADQTGRSMTDILAWLQVAAGARLAEGIEAERSVLLAIAEG